jgi:hypothetical protein
MTRSKIIAAIVAAFCGLALQFQVSGANAQTGTYFVDNTNVDYATATYLVSRGEPLCSPYWHTCLMVDGYGYLYLVDWRGNILWEPAPIGAQDCFNTYCENNVYSPGCFSCYTEPTAPGAYLQFQNDGNAVLYAPDSSGNFSVHSWRTGTTGYDPGVYLAVQDNGDFVIYDINWQPLWAATWDPRYNWNEQALIAPNLTSQCPCPVPGP